MVPNKWSMNSALHKSPPRSWLGLRLRLSKCKFQLLTFRAVTILMTLESTSRYHRFSNDLWLNLDLSLMTCQTWYSSKTVEQNDAIMLFPWLQLDERNGFMRNEGGAYISCENYLISLENNTFLFLLFCTTCILPLPFVSMLLVLTK